MLINREKLCQAVDHFKEMNVLVIGDIIVDHFIWGTVTRISPEAPVPVVNVTGENFLLGGSANVLNNLYSLGALAEICGVVGQDFMGNHLLELLSGLGSPAIGVVKTTDRPTTRKTRVLAQGQQMLRFDREESVALPPEIIDQLKSFIDDRINDFDAVIVSDYAKGVISQTLTDHLRSKMSSMSSGKNIPVIVDPKPGHSQFFRQASIITPNNREAQLMSGVEISDDASLLRAAAGLRESLDCEAVLITRGEKGMALLEENQSIFTIPTVAKEVYDVTGAGDTVVASLALGLASGLNYAEAATLANFAAGIVVGKVGTATASRDELFGVIK